MGTNLWDRHVGNLTVPLIKHDACNYLVKAVMSLSASYIYVTRSFVASSVDMSPSLNRVAQHVLVLGHLLLNVLPACGMIHMALLPNWISKTSYFDVKKS